ncbi:uncharacterized protein [Amphiura filiformis]|uniref:uncharacterized protein n=1 Tax=Amphiura filiformis TaxID=82378 RepID=UPI003B220773
MTISLAPEKRQNIYQKCVELSRKIKPTIRQVATVIGKVVAAFPGVQHGPLYYRGLETTKIEALSRNRGNFDAKTELNNSARNDLNWWLANILADSTCSPIQQPKPSIYIESDASGQGWGGTNGDTEIGGRWNAEELSIASRNEINYLELLTVFYNLKAFCKHCSNVHVHVKVDNKTAMTYVNHMGGTRSRACNKLVKEIWQWCISRNIWLSASYLPGVENVTADRKSRKFDDNIEWMLHKMVFQKICKLFGTPEIDLFASRLNKQLPRYISSRPDPEAENIDAFSVNWEKLQFYAFPPFCLMPKCIQKIETDRAEGIVIVCQVIAYACG